MLRNFDSDLSGIFKALYEYDYAVIQSGNYQQSINFPYSFIIGNDVDIFISDDGLESAAITIKSKLDEKYLIYGIHTVMNDKDSDGKIIKSLYQNNVIIEFDLIVKMTSLSTIFMRDCLARSIIDDGLKRLSLNDELNYRLAAFFNSKGSKVYHARFVKEHLGVFSFLTEAFDKPDAILDFWNNFIVNDI